MMKIKRNNYEIYFLDYYEGNLDKSQVDEILLFISQNPDLEEEFKNFENISISPDLSIKFDNKNKLKKHIISPVKNINERNYQNYFIADLEGDLSLEDSCDLKNFIDKNPCLKKDYEQFKLSFINPDKSIIFDKKESLKKYPFKNYLKKYVYYPVSIAASVLIILYFFFNNTNKQNISSRYEIARINTSLNINSIKTDKQIHNIKIKKLKSNIGNGKILLALENPNILSDELEYRNDLNIDILKPKDINNIFPSNFYLAQNEGKILFKRFEFIELLYFSDLHNEILLAEINNQSGGKTIVKKGVNLLKKLISFNKNTLNNKPRGKFLSAVSGYRANKIKQGNIKPVQKND